MEFDELRRRLEAILAAEEQQPANWSEVERLAGALQPRLHTDATPEIVFHYLDDADIRARDEGYALEQRSAVRRFIERGDYDDGTPMPLWGRALAVLLAIGVAWWLAM